MAEPNGWYAWSPNTNGMMPLFYNHDPGEDEIGPGDERERREVDELLAEQPTEDDEKVVLRFKQGLKDAGRDKQAMGLWLARHFGSPCTTCKRGDQCERKEGKTGCIPCQTAHRRCSTTKAYMIEHAAACAGISTETGNAMYEKYGTTKRASGPRKKAVKMEIEVDVEPRMGTAVVERENGAKLRGRKRKRVVQDIDSARLDLNVESPSKPPPAQPSQARFTPSLLLNSPAVDDSYIAPMSVMLPSVSHKEYSGITSNPRTFSTALVARRSIAHAATALPSRPPSTSTSLRNDLNQENTQYNALKKSYDRLRKEKMSLEAEALKKQTESRKLVEEVKILNEYRDEVADLKAEITRLKRMLEEASMKNVKASRATERDSQERAEVLQRHLAGQQMNHMRLSARVGQVELMLRRIVNAGTRGRDDKDALLKIALEELSSCLHDDMGSRMEHWNPFNNSGVVFRPDIVPSLLFNQTTVDSQRQREVESKKSKKQY